MFNIVNMKPACNMKLTLEGGGKSPDLEHTNKFVIKSSIKSFLSFLLHFFVSVLKVLFTQTNMKTEAFHCSFQWQQGDTCWPYLVAWKMDQHSATSPIHCALTWHIFMSSKKISLIICPTAMEPEALTVYLSHFFSGSYGSHRLAGKMCLFFSYQLRSTTLPAWD